jgi:hypothetical protein
MQNSSNDHAMKAIIGFSMGCMGKMKGKGAQCVRLIGSFCAGGSL